MLIGSVATAEAEGVMATSRNSMATSRNSLESLYAQYIDEAVRLGYVLTGSREAGEDLAQEAFVRVASHLGVLRDATRFEAYLKKTIVNLARSTGRKLQRERKYLLRRGASPTPIQEQYDGSAHDDLWDALMRLPARQRAVVFLRYYNDLSFRQIADTLDCSTGAAKALCARALKGLRSNWGEGNE